jgi:hypothetical protein
VPLLGSYGGGGGAAATEASIGASDGSTSTVSYLDFAGVLFLRINSTDDGPAGPNSNAQGFWIGTRTRTSAVSVYRNGAMFGSTATTPSSGVPSVLGLPMRYQS